MSSIILHRKYGVNPTMTTCFYCGKSKDILLVGASVSKFKEAGLAKPDGEMNQNIGVVDMEPCNECKKLMEMGIMFISVRDGESGKNPHRTGKMSVLKEDAVRRLLNPPAFERICKSRFAFIEDATWDEAGLPKTNINNIKEDK